VAGASAKKEEDEMNGVSKPDRLRLSAILTGGLALIALGLGVTAYSAITNAGPLMFVVGLLAWTLAGYNGAFHAHITSDEMRLLPVVAISSLMATAAGTAVGIFFGVEILSAPSLAVVASTSAISLFVGIAAGRRMLQYLWRRGEFRSTAVVVGSGQLSSELAIELRHRPELGIDVIDELRIGSTIDPFREEDIDQIHESVLENRPDRLLVGELDADDLDLLPTLRLAGQIGTRVYVLPRLFEMGVGNSLFAPDRLRGFPLLRVNRCAHPELAFALKRLIDITASALALLILSPLLLAVAVAIKVTSPGAVLFWQERVGRGDEVIMIPKFRSMSHSDASDTEWTAQDRVTTIGRVLRRTAIDEIPQLWSVLTGTMSLVGPRPERPSFAHAFSEEYEGYTDRLRMRVGLTGLSQIAGLRGDTSIRERTKFDNLYIDQWSLVGDLVIMFRTVGAIVGERRRAQTQLDFEAILSARNLGARPDLLLDCSDVPFDKEIAPEALQQPERSSSHV